MKCTKLYCVLPIAIVVLVAVTVRSDTVVAVATEEESLSSIDQKRRTRRIMNHPIAGGYASMSHSQLRTNERVQEIAQYILDTLIDAAGTTTSNNGSGNSNNNKYSFQSQFVEHRNEVWNATVVTGNQQVVAGMNYHLTIVITKVSTAAVTAASLSNEQNTHIVVVTGGFDVVVYDQFGTLSITRWGTELSMDDAKVLFTNYISHVDGDIVDDDDDDDDIATTNVNTILDSEGK